ncbi:subclass B3 metallo-beta-lactamase [Mucilaginibacter daejeonensis]|uniref:subclass B3 metallo-beta-lactamase n=1 Tax=Mucilaginibacter daejeonensis TaxID=398049 RepID=UPI001D1771F7|nr:subclass B3 metallo-beta-lactamase [Mucilaginibacter daejeonensis]UEG54721.1 subclass B3 metallo-beta-lactamase [Mucilaginibacter daejeonensis]
MKRYLINTVFALTFVICGLAACAQVKVQEPNDTPGEWSKPYPPFRIAGDLYYVGTEDLACYLITTNKGNILINTGLANSADIIANNIKTLGFKLSDTKILLTTQAHYDHMGAMAAIKARTGAKMLVDAADAQVMKDGGASDYALGNGKPTYTPLKPDGLLHDRDVIELGNVKLTMLHHPGHTKGSCSYLFDVKDDQRTYRVLIANMPTIVASKPFDQVTAYPQIAQDYAYTLKAMAGLKFDIWLASHASQFDLQGKHKPGSAYNPSAFIDQGGYDELLSDLNNAYQQKLKQK